MILGSLVPKRSGLGISLAGPTLKKPCVFREVDGDPCRIRTCDNLLRRQVLYPTELRGRSGQGPRKPLEDLNGSKAASG